MVPGARPADGRFTQEHVVQLYYPVIVTYRDESSDAATGLEAASRRPD